MLMHRRHFKASTCFLFLFLFYLTKNSYGDVDMCFCHGNSRLAAACTKLLEKPISSIPKNIIGET